eukprot:TRINITY_DN33052_c0_g1_i1.p2 TRINITY_DN33052_c0_g1~~TRINITY_DN33052_c0_g1_i1.p2  ORF type:complete len:320 (+),score=94.84 TRINITY_DN33052_c0_g1_i1:68-961(+)
MPRLGVMGRGLLLAGGAALVAAAAAAASGRVGLGHINLLFDPHEVTIALNPSGPGLEWVGALRERIPEIRAEANAVGERMLQPHEAYLSKEFQGGKEVGEAGEVRGGAAAGEKPWDWAILRAGGVDTCLAAHFPRTLKAVSDALGDGGRLTTAFFSRLSTGRDLPPHCGETRGLFRAVFAVDGPTGVVARQTVLNDHSACMLRFAKPCPANLTRLQPPLTSAVEYGVGDAVVFNDFLCHWVEYRAAAPRLALIVNVERADVPPWRTAVLRAVSSVFMAVRGGRIMGASEGACAALRG